MIITYVVPLIASKDNIFEQDDDDVLVRAFDWRHWITDGDTISTFNVTCDDDTIVIADVSSSGNLVEYTVSGGTVGERYTISCEITTTNGLTIQRSIVLSIGKL